MEYEIKGSNLPVVICRLNSGEVMVSQAGAMGWMSENIIMDTNMKGGLMGGLGRMFSGESLFLNTFTSSREPGTIAFPSSFPGKILALELKAGESIIAQKDAFLASEESVGLEVYFKRKLAAGLFGGEGFILQKIYRNHTQKSCRLIYSSYIFYYYMFVHLSEGDIARK